MSICGGGGSDSGAYARQQEEIRQGNIQTGLANIDKTFGQFNPQFYQQRAQDYTNYAMPQLYQQLAQTNRQGMYGLADRGLRVGSAANTFGSNLAREANVQKQGIIDSGIAQSQQLQKDVEGQRSQLVAQLQASADPTSASRQALQAASAYSLPSAFQPLGNLFQTFGNLYANGQLSNAYNSQNYKPNYGLSSTLGNSSYSIKR